MIGGEAAGRNRWAKLLVRIRLPRGWEARFLGALDLSDSPIVHDELHDAEAEAFDCLAHQREPFGQ